MWQARTLFYLLLSAFLIGLHLSFAGYAGDDAYIHFRIAENLLRSGVPYFNPDQAIMGSSSSAWTLLLAGLFGIFGVSVKAVAVLNALLLTFLAFFLSALLSRGARKLSADLCSAALVLLIVLPTSLGLMETGFALTLSLWGLSRYHKHKTGGLVLLSAAMHVRPECAVFLALWTLRGVISRKISIATALREIIVGSLPFLVYDIFFFGTLIPHAAVAKARVYAFSYADVLKSFQEGIGTLQGTCSGGSETLLTVALALISLWAIYRFVAAKVAHFAFSDFWLFAASAVLVMSGYVLGKAPVFPWYVPLFWLPLVCASVVGARREKLLFAAVTVLCIPFFKPLAENLSGIFHKQSCHYYFLPAARVRSYLEIGSELNVRFPHAELLASEVGALGFAFKGKVIDGVGLTSPEVLPYHPLRVPEERDNPAIGAVPPMFIAATLPGLIVSMEKLLPHFDESPAAGYYLLEKRPLVSNRDNPAGLKFSLWGNQSIEILLRKNLLEKAQVLH